MESNALKICPRCDSQKVDEVVKSPIPDKWIVLRCNQCNYLWRNTENLKQLAKITEEMLLRATEVIF